jgi:CRISPR-associated protein Cas1
MAWSERMAETELVVERAGAFVGKRSERVRVSVKGETISEQPLYGLEQVLIAAEGVALSSDVVRECAERGIPITFLSWSGAAYARLVAPGLTGTVRTRREQLLAYGDGRGVALAQAFATGKLGNQANLLRYMVKNYRGEPELYAAVREAAFQIQDHARRIQELEGAHVDALREGLLVREAHAAKWYWEAARRLVEIPEWEGRETRGAEDLVNSCLNYGYGCLYSRIEHAVILAGLDPYAGFIHADRAGKPSLVLDLIEEFRQPVVDRTVFGLLNRGVKLAVTEGRLTDDTRRTLAQKVTERLEGEEPYVGKRHKLRTIIQLQARRVATHVRGEATYQPWLSRW